MTAGLTLVLVVPVLCYWLDARWTIAVLQVGTFLLAAIQSWRSKGWRSHPALIALSLPILIASVQLLAGLTLYAYPTIEALLSAITNALLFGVSLQILDRQHRQPFLQRLGLFAAALSVLATLQLFTSDGKVWWRFPVEYKDSLMGPFLNRNQYAAFMELLFPIAMLCALRDRNRRAMWSAGAAAMFASVIASASRAGAAFLTAEAIAVLGVAYRRDFLDRKTFVLVAATLGAMTVCFTALVGWERLENRITKPDVFETRRDLRAATWKMIRERPLTGFGLGNWAIAYPRFATVDDGRYANQAHNDWLQTFAEGGAPAFLALLSFTLLIARPAWRSVWGIGILAFLAHGLVDYPLQKPILMAWMSVLAGAAATASEDSRLE